MLVNLQEVAREAGTEDRIIVVGAGAVGLPLAIDLARRGRRVLLLEAGPAELNKDSQRFFENATSVGRRLEGLHLGRFRVLGGSTIFWGGQLVPFDAVTYSRRDWVSNDAVWPIGPNDLDPYFDRAYKLLAMPNVLDDAAVLRRLAVKPPALPDELSFFLTRWAPEPNFANLFRREMASSRQLMVVTGASVVSLIADESGTHLTGVDVSDDRGERHRFTGGTVILANGTIEIARLLSVPFADGREPPWSTNPWVGRGFMDHIDGTAAEVRPLNKRRFHELFDNAFVDGVKYQPKIKLSELGQRDSRLLGVACHFIFGSSITEDLANAKIFFRALLGGQMAGRLSEIPARLKTLGFIGVPMALRYLRHRRIYNPADLGIHLRVTTEQRSLRRSRVILRPERDATGLPMVSVDWHVDGCELETIARFTETVAKYLSNSGLAQAKIDARLLGRDPAFLDQFDDAYHHMGTARMSNDPNSGVVDRDLRVHGMRNLYVAGAAVYPSSGFANPTFTAIALGLRLAERIVRISH